MSHVRLHAAEGIILDIDHLDGVMISRSASAPVFDDQRSYVLEVSAGEVSMSLDSLQTLLKEYVFNGPRSPLKDVKVSTDGQHVKLSGTLVKGIGIPFSTKSRVSASPDGRLLLSVDSMKALGVPARGLLGIFGLKLDDLVSLKDKRGIEITENNILITPGQILPPPELRGRLVSVSLRGNTLTQTFGTAQRVRAASQRAPAGRNYIYFSNGTITFGKLTMHDADLQLVDADPRDAFDFYPARYKAQLVAGYSKNTVNGGLKTFMPDYDDLRRRR